MPRRTVLGWLSASGLVPGCIADPSIEPEAPALPDREDVDWPDAPDEPLDDLDEGATENVRALMDVLIPTERDETGNITAPGALEAGALEMLDLSRFLPSARALALIPETATPGFEDLEAFDAALTGLLSADLDALSFRRRPLTSFRNLQRSEQEDVIREALADPLTRPLLIFARAAAFIAFLGAVFNDEGLVHAGFPRFEDFEAGIANRGYPRTVAGVVEDYTYNLTPPATEGDDLSALLDENGDIR